MSNQVCRYSNNVLKGASGIISVDKPVEPVQLLLSLNPPKPAVCSEIVYTLPGVRPVTVATVAVAFNACGTPFW